jgi:hypothetical protein
MTPPNRRPGLESRGVGLGRTILFVVLLIGVAVLAVTLM